MLVPTYMHVMLLAPKEILTPEALVLESNPFEAKYLLGDMIGSLCGIQPIPTSQPVIWVTLGVGGGHPESSP